MTDESKEHVDYMVDHFGNTIEVYSPNATYNDEGDKTIDLGTPKTSHALMFDASAEESIVKIEGIDLTQTYRVYLKADESVNRETIIKWDGNHYKIISLSKIAFMDTIAYLSLVITKTSFKQAS